MSRVITLQPGGGVQSGNDDRPPEEGKHKVRCYTPDKTAYHQSELGTIIPRAKSGKGGGSMGQTPGAKQFTVVAGGVGQPSQTIAAIEPTRITPESSRQAFEEACRETDNDEDRIALAYQKLGVQVSVSQPEPEPDRSHNPLMAGYVTPATTPGGAQVKTGTTMPVPQPKASEVPQQPQVPQQPVQQPVQPPTGWPQPGVNYNAEIMPQQRYVEPGYQQAPQPYLQPAPAPMDPALLQMMQQLAQGQQQLADAVLSLRTPPTEATQNTEPVSESYPMTSLAAESELSADEVRLRETVSAAVNKAFENLGIPNLNLQPGKPLYQVEFDLGKAGLFHAFYHWVGVKNKGLFLVYDTRFEYGTLYSPPDREDPMVVRLPDHDREFKCYSSNFVHEFGVFRIINLVIDQQAATAARDAGAPPPIDEVTEHGGYGSLDHMLGADDG